jgi:SAM-dependent methyltransferase
VKGTFGLPVGSTVSHTIIAVAAEGGGEGGSRDGQNLKPRMDGHEVLIPDSVFVCARDTMGAFFEPISKVDRTAAARDFLDLGKSRKRAEILARYALLHGKKLLEIGSGFGTNLAVWITEYGIDGYGVEPSGEGFDAGLHASRDLLAANGIAGDRIVDAVGEHLPFADQTFDIVYSANVLEHTQNPSAVVREAIRVLRPGGILHIEVPNHWSYFEGHYLLVMPPLVNRSILPAWVSLFGRDATFSRTLQTQINPRWFKRVLAEVGQAYPLHVISLGDDLFLERLAKPFQFEAQGVSRRLGAVLRVIQLLNRGNWIGKLIVAAQGYYPLYVTVRRNGLREGTSG